MKTGFGGMLSLRIKEDANSIVFAEIINIENKSRSIFVGQAEGIN